MKIEDAKTIAGLYDRVAHLRHIQKDMSVVLQRDEERIKNGYTTVTLPIRWLDMLIRRADDEIAAAESEIEAL